MICNGSGGTAGCTESPKITSTFDAKLLFGISGYSVFDNLIIDKLNIVESNLEIDFIKEFEYIFEINQFDKITILICLSIWLANNSCFTNINKKITSIMIAYYYCEKYIDYC